MKWPHSFLPVVLAYALTLSAWAGKGGVGPSKISLPSGPGSIEGLGDAFEPHLNTGTSSYSIPLAGPPGVSGLKPNLTLNYNSGNGNGHFGIAWSCGAITSIMRQTEKGIPTYGNGDRFTLNGEELVPLSDGSYRTETEGGSRRIRRTAFQAGTGWEITDPNGTRHYLGTAALAVDPSRQVRPGGGERFEDTFRWLVQESIDVHGNRMTYQYTQFPDSPGDTYLTEIRYSIFGPAYHSVTFDYESRGDILSSYLSGFEIRAARRCSQIRIASQGDLVRRWRIGYSLPANDPVERIAPTDAGLSLSLIHQVTPFDNGPTDANYIPPLRFGYTRLDVAKVQRGTFLSPTGYSLANPNLSLSDMNCDSLPDFFFTDPLTGRHSVYFSQGLGRWSPERLYTSVPTGTSLDSESTSLADYDGDGRIDLVQKVGSETYGHFVYYPNTTLPIGNNELTPSWGPERAFASNPAFDLDAPSVRTLDLNNDRLLDAMRTTPLGFLYYYNRDDEPSYWEEDGLYLFGEAEMGDISAADGISFEDTQHVKLMDMNGDRLLDLVRVHVSNQPQPQLEMVWWPNRGRGRWGNRVIVPTVLPLGVISLEDCFFFDVNGDGLGDVASVSVDHVIYWINQGTGNFSNAFQIAATPDYIKGQTVLITADINGNGSTDFLWQNWDASAGAWRVSWVDFMGVEKPNLLKIIDNGIGLQTEFTYRTSTDYYVAALLGSNPWTTRLPLPSWCIASSTRRFGLNLDAVAGEDAYKSEYSYFNGYYDGQEKEFRGFAFSRKIERGDDQLRPDGTPTQAEVNSPSTITRAAYHTGVPDGLDNDGDNQVDERDVLSGYEEEALKGTLLWTETTVLTAEFDGLDNDGDGFIDESDEGPGSGRLAPDDFVFLREYQQWTLKTLYDGSGGISQLGLEMPYTTQNHQQIKLPYMAVSQRSVIDARGSLHNTEPFAAGATTVTTRGEVEVDLFGRKVVERDYGITSGGALSYDDERFTYTTYAYRPDLWIMGVPTEVKRTDENGVVASRQRTYYDDLAFGQIGTRGLVTASEDFLFTSGIPLDQPSAVPGDPRLAANASILDRNVYDAYGNLTLVRDAAYTQPGNGHEREYTYDPVFHTYVERETVRVGQGKPDLVKQCVTDYGSGAIKSTTDYNGNVSYNVLDSFFRAVALVQSGDTLQHPSKKYSYHPADRVRGLVYNYDAAGNLTVTVAAEFPVVSRVETKVRETAGGGTLDSISFSDGAGHSLGRIDESDRPDQWIFSELSNYTARGAVREVFRPFFGSQPIYTPPPANGARLTNYYDSCGRVVRVVNPPEDDAPGSPRTEHRYVFLPHQTISFDEGDADAASPHFGTPKITFSDGFGRLLRIDELNREGTTLKVYSTRYEYNLLDSIVRTQDSQNNVKWMRYDGLQRLISINDLDRGLSQFTYDLASNPIRRLDAKGQVIDMTYDGMNRMLTEDYLDARGLTPDVTFTYDTPVTVPAGDGSMVTNTQTKGALSQVTDLSGAEVISYDARDRVVWEIKRVPDPATGLLVSYQTKTEYDSNDRVTTSTYPDNDHVEFRYNSRSLPSAIVGGPAGFLVSQFKYDPAGRLLQTDYGNGVTTTYRYDPRQRVRNITTLSPQQTPLFDCDYTLDSASQLTRIDDNRPTSAIPANVPRRNTQVFAYDDLYRLQAATYPAANNGTGGEITYRHDQIGNIVEQNSNMPHTDRGRSVTHLGSMSYGGANGSSGRMGRANGQPGPHALTQVAAGARNVTYDANGNVVTQDGLTQTWDFKDRLIASENADMRAEYTYDHSDSRVTKRVVDKRQPMAQPEITHYISPSFEIRPGQEIVKYVWSGNTRVARVATTLHPSEQVQRFSLRAGWNVLALAVTLADGTSQFQGTPVDQALRWVEASGEYFQLAANDPVPAGTLLRVHATTAATLSLRGLRAAGTVAQNVAVGGQWLLNTRTSPLDLAAIVPPTDPLWFFEANSQTWSLRLPSVANASAAPRWLQPGEAVFTTVTAPYALTTPDPALSVRFYHADHLGSASVITDAAGALVSEATYYPFGQPRHEFTPRAIKTDYGFTQKERDAETGLSHFEARYLNSAAGRFVSVDPLLAFTPAALATSPQRQNLYAYCQSSPLNCIDPSGCEAIPLVPDNKYVSVTANLGLGYEGSLEVGVGKKVGNFVAALVNIKGSFKVTPDANTISGEINGFSVINKNYGSISLIGGEVSRNLTSEKTTYSGGVFKSRLFRDTLDRTKAGKERRCEKMEGFGEICLIGKVGTSIKGMVWDPGKTKADGTLDPKNYCGSVKVDGNAGVELEGSPTPVTIVTGTIEMKGGVTVEICTPPPWEWEAPAKAKPDPTLNVGSACGTSHHQARGPVGGGAMSSRFEGLSRQLRAEAANKAALANY